MDKYLTKTKNGDKNESTTSSKTKLTTSTKRKYNDEYIEFAFIPSENHNSLPVCLLCSTNLSNETMVPSNLERHFERNHPEYANKPKAYFENLRSQTFVHKASFSELKLSTFWISLFSQYPELSAKAVRALLPFGSSYLCELGFSSLTEMKSKKRERLQMIDGEMRVCLSNIEPRITKICLHKQAHTSH